MVADTEGTWTEEEQRIHCKLAEQDREADGHGGRQEPIPATPSEEPMTPNAEYELLLLGSLTHYGATVAKPILDVMVSEHFADPMARQLFGVLKYATSNGLPLGEVEVYEYAKELGVMIEVDKLCVMPVVAKSDLDAHMLHLQDLASRRALKRAAAELAAETGLTADEIIDKYSGRLAQFRSVG